jgi:hypothetical protein
VGQFDRMMYVEAGPVIGRINLTQNIYTVSRGLGIYHSEEPQNTPCQFWRVSAAVDFYNLFDVTKWIFKTDVFVPKFSCKSLGEIHVLQIN